MHQFVDPGPSRCQTAKSCPGVFFYSTRCVRLCDEADGCYWNQFPDEEPDPPRYPDPEVQVAYDKMQDALDAFQSYARPGSWKKFKNLQDVFGHLLKTRLGEVPSWEVPVPEWKPPGKKLRK